MSLVTRPIPGLFGGVSQKIPAMRHATQCAVQDNALSTVVDGLYKRPGTKHEATLPLTGNNGQSVQGALGDVFCHTIDKGPAGLFQLVLVNGNLILYSMLTGAAESVSFPHGTAYLNTATPSADFRCVTVADYTFIINRSKPVEMLPGTTPANPTNVGYIDVKTAVPNVTYTVVANGVSASNTTGTTPNSRAIATALASMLQAGGITSYVLPNTNVIKVTSSGPVSVSVNDTWGNQTMKLVHTGVDTFAQLPAQFEAGFVVPIRGSASDGKDTYYVRWDPVLQRWVETTAPGTTTVLAPAAMPHQLRRNEAGGWTFEMAAWEPRKVGSDATNPAPSFVGRTIRDVFFFRNRLGFLAGDAVSLSRAGDYFDFWGSTTVQQLDSDPIDLGSTAENVETLDAAVPFNQDLLIWASPRQQFVLGGGDLLTPSTARLLPTTTYEVDTSVKPQPLGNRVVYVSRVGASSQVNIYRVSEDTVTNMADDLTEHCPNYVPANPRMVAVSTSVRAIAVVPPDADAVYLFKYEWGGERTDMTQQAWQRFTFSHGSGTSKVLAVHWVSRKLYILKRVVLGDDPVGGGRLVLESIDLEPSRVDQDAGIALCLDSLCRATVGAFNGTSTTLTLPAVVADGVTLLRCLPGAEPTELTITSLVRNWVTGNTQITVAGDASGTVWAGRKFLMTYEFTEVFLRDAQEVPIMASHVKLVRILLRYVKTGWFKALVYPHLRSSYTYPFSGRTIGQPGQGPNELSLSTGTFNIPVMHNAPDTRIVLESDSWLPCTFPYAEWVGDIKMKAQR